MSIQEMKEYLACALRESTIKHARNARQQKALREEIAELEKALIILIETEFLR
ncbi:MAG: hypothetical protein ACLST1_11050 [[Eubacterium] siraeum]